MKTIEEINNLIIAEDKPKENKSNTTKSKKSQIEKLNYDPNQKRVGVKKNGGAREGAGRPKGKKSKETMLRLKALRNYRVRVSRLTSKLLNHQLSLAEGCQYLFKKMTVGKKRISVMVENPQEIVDYLDGKFDKLKEQDGKSTYYYITTKTPDAKALNDILDRTYGKATQMIGGDEENPIIINTYTDEQIKRLAKEISERE
jgi:hypothetical protein